MYKFDNYYYLIINQGFEFLVEASILLSLVVNYNKEGYIKRLFVDFWGNDYVFVNFGEYGVYDLFLVGFDGEMGIEDDIINWGLSKKKK